MTDANILEAAAGSNVPLPNTSPFLKQGPNVAQSSRVRVSASTAWRVPSKRWQSAAIFNPASWDAYRYFHGCGAHTGKLLTG